MGEREKRWRHRHSIAAVAGLLAAGLLSLCAGRYAVTPGEVFQVLTGRTDPQQDYLIRQVVLSVRLPRILAALLCGGALAAAGAGLQAVFANPLASADTLGIGSAASFGAVLAILCGASAWQIQLSAFLAGILSLVCVFAAAGRKQEDSLLMLVLAGMVIGSFFTALLSFVKYIADPQEQLPSIVYWLMGNLKNCTWNALLWGAGWMLAGGAGLFFLRWKLDILLLKEGEAQAIGVPVHRIRVMAILCSAAMTAAVVSMCGQIGWVGLLIPHLCRMLFGAGNRNVIPASMAAGAFFLLAADTLARCVTASEIPVSLVTSLIGAPVFLMLLKKTGGLAR